MKLLFPILLLSLIGCHGGWLKDPFADKAENVKKAQDPTNKEKPSIPLKDVVFIDVPEFYDFTVGRERTITFEYRVTHQDLFAIELDAPGIEDILTGSTYDRDKSQLVWTPPEDFVTGAQFIRRIPITLILYVDNKGVTEEYRKTIAINIIRNTLETPEIIKVTGLISKIKEEKRDAFRVTVRDPDSDPQNRPSLAVISTSTGASDGAGLVVNLDNLPSKDINDRTLWHFDMRVDLSGKEVTENYQKKKFGLRAVSGMGLPSVAWKGEFQVLTQIVEPEFFIQDTVFYKDQENSYTFSIVDPKKEGAIHVGEDWIATCSNLDPAADCSCKEVGSQASCTIRWKPTVTGTTNFNIKASNNINSQFQQDSVTGSSKFAIDVQEAGS